MKYGVYDLYYMGKEKDKVSVLIPCRNEVQNIEGCLNHIFNFEPPNGGFEVIVIDGISTDGTREVLFRLKTQHPEMVLIENENKTVSYGMNLGIQKAKGEYIVRTDVRCIHPKSYLRDLIELSERTGADNVGGVLVPISGETYVQKSIALAYKSRIAMGGALRDRGDFVGETDTVYGGCFKRQRLLEIGMYDEEMVRNQDDELSFRLRKRGEDHPRQQDQGPILAKEILLATFQTVSPIRLLEDSRHQKASATSVAKAFSSSGVCLGFDVFGCCKLCRLAFSFRFRNLFGKLFVLHRT